MKKKTLVACQPVELKKQALESWENEGGEIPSVSKALNEVRPEATVEGRREKKLRRTLTPSQRQKTAVGKLPDDDPETVHFKPST